MWAPAPTPNPRTYAVRWSPRNSPPAKWWLNDDKSSRCSSASQAMRVDDFARHRRGLLATFPQSAILRSECLAMRLTLPECENSGRSRPSTFDRRSRGHLAYRKVARRGDDLELELLRKHANPRRDCSTGRGSANRAVIIDNSAFFTISIHEWRMSPADGDAAACCGRPVPGQGGRWVHYRNYRQSRCRPLGRIGRLAAIDDRQGNVGATWFLQIANSEPPSRDNESLIG
jgi:hypothetical protein